MATQEDKTTLNYRVVETENPLTGESVKRPVITNRPTYPLARVVRKAIDSGRIRGKYHDLVGIANGLMDEIQVLMNEGASINTGYQRYHLELTGSVGDDLRLTEANGLKTCITPMSDLKLNVEDFNWHRVDDNGIKLTLSTIKGEGVKLGLVMPGKKATINGRNLVLLEGDSVTAKCVDVTEACEVIESDEDHAVIVIPEAFNSPELAKKDIVITVRSRCGDEENAFQTKSIRATLLEGEPHNPKIVSVVSGMNGREGQVRGFEDTLTITGEDLSFDGVKFRYVMIGADGEVKSSTRFDRDGDIVTYLSPTCVQFKAIGNYSDQPTDNWISDVISNEKYLEARLKDGTILRYPIIFVGED